MPDTIAPTLSALSLPKTIDLSQGPATATFSVGAVDDLSGIESVVIWLDDDLTRRNADNSYSTYSTFSLINFADRPEEWEDGEQAQTLEFSDVNAPGIYNVESVVVEDVSGNTRTYYTSDLDDLGFNTSMEITGSQADTIAPNRPQASIANEFLEVTEGKSIDIVLEFTNLLTESFTYSYRIISTNESTADESDYGASAGSGAYSISSTTPQERSQVISFSALSDLAVEGTETAILEVELDGITFPDGHSREEFEVSILDNRRPSGTVSLSGDATQGDTLTLDTSSITDADGLGDFDIQWTRDGSAISGATGSSYTLTETDVGAEVAATASYVDGLGVEESVSSAGQMVTSSEIPAEASEGERIEGDGANDLLTGTAGDDGLLGKAGDDTISGGDGDDNIAAGSGYDSATGGDGNDMIGGGEGNDTLSGDQGNDTIGGGFGDDSISGGDGDDVVAAGAGNDIVKGNAGDDTMGASYSDDVVSGGAGNDSLGGGTGKDLVNGDAGADSIGGGEGDDTVNGGGGDDFLAGGGRDDVVSGGTGEDTLNGGSGSDTLTGGSGDDQFVFNDFYDGDFDVIEDFEVGADVMLLVGIENELGTGLQGRLDALALTDTEDGAHFEYGGNTVALSGVRASELALDNFMFV